MLKWVRIILGSLIGLLAQAVVVLSLIGLGHTLAFPLLIMLVSMYLGHLPGPMKRLTWLLFGAYVLQADVLIFLRFTAPVLSAFYPLMALVDFALGLTLARRIWSPGTARSNGCQGAAGFGDIFMNLDIFCL